MNAVTGPVVDAETDAIARAHSDLIGRVLRASQVVWRRTGIILVLDVAPGHVDGLTHLLDAVSDRAKSDGVSEDAIRRLVSRDESSTAVAVPDDSIEAFAQLSFAFESDRIADAMSEGEDGRLPVLFFTADGMILGSIFPEDMPTSLRRIGRA